MIKVTVITTAGKKSDIFEETKTPKEVLDYFDIDYSVATNSLDGVKLDIAGMNRSLRELGVGKECRLSSIVKIDNAAQIVITGSAAVLVSDIKLEDWKRIEKLMPEAMSLMDEETNEVVFKVSCGEGSGSVNEYGVMFGESAGKDGKAEVTMMLDPSEEDKVQMVKDHIGHALIDLITLEKEVPDTLKEINDMEEVINGHIVQM